MSKHRKDMEWESPSAEVIAAFFRMTWVRLPKHRKAGFFVETLPLLNIPPLASNVYISGPMGAAVRDHK